MYDLDTKTPYTRLTRSVLFVLVSVLGIVSILASNGGGGGNGSFRTPPSVDYSDLPTNSLDMSTDSADTATTDAALAIALGQLDLSDIEQTIENALTPFYLPSYSNEDCPDGGTNSLTVDVATPGTLTVGDHYTAAFSACNDSGITADGSLSTEIISVGLLNQAGLPSDERFVGAELQLDYNNLAFTDSSGYEVIDGDMTLRGDNTTGYERVIISGTSVAVADNSQTVRMTNYTLWAGQDDTGATHISTNYTFASSRLGGIFQVATLTPFTITSGDIYPSTGSMTVTGTSGNGVRLTVIDATQVQLDYEFNGDSQFDDYTVVKDWISLPIDTTDIIILKQQSSKPRFTFPEIFKMTP